MNWKTAWLSLLFMVVMTIVAGISILFISCIFYILSEISVWAVGIILFIGLWFALYRIFLPEKENENTK